MKPDGTPFRPNPNLPPFVQGPPQAQLDSLLDLAQEHAEDALREDGALFPSLFAASPKGLFLFVTGKAYDREERGLHHRVVWFEATVLGRRVPIKAIAHRDEHFGPVMTLLCADEPDPFSKWPSP
jgi:hypothetical protein